MTRKIEIVEVAPRDGLQNEKTLFDHAQKRELIARLDAAGTRRSTHQRRRLRDMRYRCPLCRR